MAGKYGQSSYVHSRFSSQMPPTSGLLAFFEMMAPQEVYGGGIVFQHMSAQALRDTMTGLELFDAAREKGIQVIGELYPYDYGASDRRRGLPGPGKLWSEHGPGPTRTSS